MDIFWGKVSLEQFLSEYWQKKPLLIRGGLTKFESPLSPDELAGLSTEEGTTSRIVVRENALDWKVLYGPFGPEDFAKLPAQNYTLLVQEVECFSQEVLDLKRKFRFLPDWRMDDVMVSYASNGGGVGPHVDYYDVFLIQGLGKRHWKIGSLLDYEPEYIEDLDLRIMKDFTVTEEWILEPGDILYLPPMVPHDGVAIGDCMTFSVGFRSPAHDEMLAAWSRSIGVEMLETRRFQGKYLPSTTKPGEISSGAIQEAIEILSAFPKEPLDVAKWFGRLVTAPKRGDAIGNLAEVLTNGLSEEDLNQFAELFKEETIFEWNEQFRLAYFLSGTSVYFFVDGEFFELHLSLAPIVESISKNREFGSKEFGEWSSVEGAIELLASLEASGMICRADQLVH